MQNTFQTERTKYYTEKIREISKELPLICGSFLRSIEDYTSVLTRYAYATDLRVFFRYLINEVSAFSGKPSSSVTQSDLNALTATDIEMYMEYLSFYSDENDNQEKSNSVRTKARKISSLRSFFKYCYKKGFTDTNVMSLIDTPKIREKAILRLEPNEVADLLDNTESGAGLSRHQQMYHQKTSIRDTAILTLFLGTGIRISELVGLDLRDINFESRTILVTRKGGKQALLAIGEEVTKALTAYSQERSLIIPKDGSEQAFFLSMQKSRITVRAVENIVEKYAQITTPQKHITPHKLRSTYGTMLYNETGDIYLVADVLGHKDVNTTRKHYAAQTEDHSRIAAEKIRLRDE